MLTVKYSAQIRCVRHIRSFRACPTATGLPLHQVDAARICREEISLTARELRRLWIAEGWGRHLARIRSVSTR